MSSSTTREGPQNLEETVVIGGSYPGARGAERGARCAADGRDAGWLLTKKIDEITRQHALDTEARAVQRGDPGMAAQFDDTKVAGPRARPVAIGQKPVAAI